jgi:hypothetical protein
MLCTGEVEVWQDPEHLYIARKWVPGMTLFDVMRAIGLLSTEDSQFYLCSILLLL